MKKLFSLGLFFMYALLSYAQDATVVRSLPNFDKIGIAGGFDLVTLRKGNSESVEIRTSNIDPERIITEVKNGILEIKMKNGSWYSNAKIKLVINYDDLKSIANSGSSDIVTEGTLKGDRFEFASSGSGDFKGDIDVRSLRIAISGSGDFTLGGKADDQDYAISGSGDINASRLQGNSAAVAISGSGDVKLNVKGKVKTSISGSGDVTNDN